MGNIITTFCNRLGISEDQACERKDHYHLSGSKNKRIGNKVCKISEVSNTYGINLDATDSVFNILKKKVLPQQGAERFLDVREIGEQKYQKFDGKDRR